MSALLDKLTSILKTPHAVYPLKTSVNNSSIRYEDENSIFYIVSLVRTFDEDTGEILMLTSDNDAWPLPDDETLIKKILARMESNSIMLGKRYKPTMKSAAKDLWLNRNHNAEWRKAFDEEQEILDQQHPMFCICGQLATGFHTSRCLKWRTAVNKRVAKRLASLIPKLEPITVPDGCGNPKNQLTA